VEVRKVSSRQGGWNRANDPVRRLITGCVSQVLQQQPFQEMVVDFGEELSVESLTVMPFSDTETTLRVKFSDSQVTRHFSVTVKEHQSVRVRT
jgi:hypothetical protein